MAPRRESPTLAPWVQPARWLPGWLPGEPKRGNDPKEGLPADLEAGVQMEQLAPPDGLLWGRQVAWRFGSLGDLLRELSSFAKAEAGT